MLPDLIQLVRRRPATSLRWRLRFDRKTVTRTLETSMSAIQATRTLLITLLWVLTVAAVIVWDQNTVSIAASGLGVAATLLLLFGLRWWRGVGAIASALFVVNWALAFAFMETGGPLLETYWSVLRAATRSSNILDGTVVLAYEAALPLLHLITSVALSVSILRRQPVE